MAEIECSHVKERNILPLWSNGIAGGPIPAAALVHGRRLILLLLARAAIYYIFEWFIVLGSATINRAVVLQLTNYVRTRVRTVVRSTSVPRAATPCTNRRARVTLGGRN